MTAITLGKFRGLKQMATTDGHFSMLAVDQRPPIKAYCAERRGEKTARFEDVRAVKRIMIECLLPHASAVLADPTYALCDASRLVAREHGMIITLEDSIFQEMADGRFSKSINNWSVDKICHARGDGVKVLTWYRPDQSEKSRAAQKEFTRRIGEACAENDIPFLLEFLVYPFPGDENHTTGYVEQQGKRADHVIRTVEEFASPDYGVDIFKLESPLPVDQVPDPDANTSHADACAEYFNALGEAAGRPWVMLSAGATKPAFRNVLRQAYRAGASGFLAGRAIWWDDFQAFPDLDAMSSGMRRNAAPYLQELSELTSREAMPWTEHPAFGGHPVIRDADAPDFPARYGI